MIILGAGRSGTKFLRQLLAASRVCRVIPSGINPVWRYGNHGYPNDALPAARCTDRIARHIREDLLRLAAVVPEDTAACLVEKSSANTLRVPFVAAVLPDACYLHLVRDGRDAVASAYQRWTAPVDPAYLLKKARGLTPSSLRFGFWYLRNLAQGLRRGRGRPATWGPRYPGIETDIASLSTLAVSARQWSLCVETALRDLATIPAERRLTLRYEDLVTDVGVITSITRFLQLPDPETVVTTYHRIVHDDRIGTWRQALSDTDLACIMPFIEPTMQQLAYEV